ncbi:MAG TPA: tRNA adenosine(34) deaminase TadA [Acidimicrobiia bacterium]|nr:tRNA adenosine(34) deaminase TadA [Acidimicrobiia bacterium]
MADPFGQERVADDERLMALALEQARQAATEGEVPIGAVLVDGQGKIISADHNRREQLADATAHAEMLVMAAAGRARGDWRLPETTLYVTLEPCPMCAGAAVNARVGTIVYGSADPKAGAAWSLYNIPQDARLNHRCEIRQGVLAEEAAELLSAFFRDQR